MRALWFVLAILVASLVPTTTRAQATVPRDQAYQHCVADMARTQAFWAATGFAGTFGANTCSDATVPQGLYRCTASQTELAGMGRCVHDFIVEGANGCTSKACPTALHGDYPFGACPSGTVWDTNSKTCFNPQRCLDKSALGNGLISGTATVGCIDGCEFAPPDGGKTLSFNGSQFIEIAKGWTPTGKGCAVAAPPINTQDPQVCKDLGDGQTACVKQDGQECYKGPIGTAMQFCWKPGEVGDKNDGSTRQKRNAGETPVAPNLSLPSGDNLQQKGPPIVTQVTNNTTTTTTTTTNYQTQHGTDANGGGKPSGDGEPSDGSGKPDDGEGEGTATGGGDCKSPPIVTGDQVLGMVANQAWQTRCAVEAGNAVKVTGDVGDCAHPFTVEGTHANAQQLRAMRAQICGDDINGNKRPDWTETNGTEEPGPGEGDDEPGFLSKTLSLENLDSSGFLGGAGSCPQMGVVDLSFTQVDLSNASWWCPFVTMCRGILLLMGFFISVRLLME